MRKILDTIGSKLFLLVNNIMQVKSKLPHYKWRSLALLFIGFIYFVFLFPSPEHIKFNKDDGSLFLTLGINLAEFGRYTMDTFNGDVSLPHATWPPGFPLFLAVIISIFGFSWIVLKLAMVISGLANLYFLKKLWNNSPEGEWAVILTGLCAPYFLFSHHTMAEIPYMLAVTVTLFIVDRTKTNRDALLAGIIGAIAFLTRGYAVTLLPTVIIFYLLKNNWCMKKRISTILWFSVPMLISVFSWAGYTSSLLASGYVDGFSLKYGNGTNILSDAINQSLMEFVKKIYWHDMRYPVYYMLHVFDLKTVAKSNLLAVLSVGLVGISMIGWVSCLFRNVSSAVIWLPITIGLILIMGQASVRYWLPFVPFLFYFFLVGCRRIARFSKFAVFYPISLMVLLTTGVIGLTQHLVSPDNLRFNNRYVYEFRNLALWANENIPQDAIVITPWASDFYVSGRRQSYNIKKINLENWPLEIMKNKNNLYLLCLTSNINEPLLPLESKKISNALLQRSSFVLINQSDNFGIYKYRGSPRNLERNEP